MNFRKQVFWWTTFVAATFALSKVFEASRLLTANPPQWSALGPLAFWAALLCIAFLILGYDAYMKARAEGKVVHRIGLYEKVASYLCQENRL